jgi:hypothetical protein
MHGAMEITPEFFLTFIKYAVIAIGLSLTAMTVLGAVVVRRVGEDAVRPVLHLVEQGDALRMLTVIFIVSAATGLVVLGKIDGGHGATILSGVAGYVLGSGARSRSGAVRRNKDRKQIDSDDEVK